MWHCTAIYDTTSDSEIDTDSNEQACSKLCVYPGLGLQGPLRNPNRKVAFI